MDDETRSRFGTLEEWIDALRSAEGFYPGAEGFRIGSTRLFEKLVSHAEHDDEYHLHQRDEDGTESDLTGARSIQGIPVSETDPTTTQILGYNAITNEWTPTAAGAAAAHKDSHDPQDGADKLDTANAAAITGVVAAGTGTSHSFARADHIHAISHSILDNRLATIDGTTNAPANLDYAKWTTLGLEGKTYAQLRADINVADGADVTGDNTPKAHGPAQHTEGNAWKMVYQDAAGDETEIAVGADGTVLTGQGAAAAPAFQAASEHAHANDHAESHAVASHNDTTATGTELETLTDGSDADSLHDHGQFVSGAEAVSAVATADPYLKNDASDSTSGTITAAGFTTTGIATLQAVAIDSTPANDTCSGTTTEFTAGAALTRGDCCYPGSDKKMEKCDADAEATSRCIAIVEEATIAEDATGTFLLHGFFEKEFNFTDPDDIGKKVYLSVTAGAVSVTAPSGTDDCIVVVGNVMGADLIYFNPSVQAIVEHT